MRRILLVAALFALALPAFAGTSFVFECHNQGSVPYSFQGKAWIEGPHARYDVIEGSHPLFNPKMSIVSRERGAFLMIIDHRQRTYFMRSTDLMTGQLALWKGPGTSKASKHTVTASSSDETAKLAGRDTKKASVHVAYNMAMELEGEKLKGRVDADASFWMMPGALEAIPYGLHFALKTGFPPIDADIAKALAGKGVPLREVVTISRTIEGGPAITETFKLDVSDVKEEPVPGSMFNAPEGYEYREPSFGFGAQ
ncbi:MAG: hypothetical protein JOZ54_17580 [Acidobacteria bacterium]|nr:hypothetical protein [Acidobacteriota bacterium]